MFQEEVLLPYLNDGFVKTDMDRMNMVRSFQSKDRRSRKGSVEECIFVYIALYIEWRFNKISLLQGYFFVILPAG